MDYALVFCRFVHYAMVFLVFGSVLFRHILGRSEPIAFSSLDRCLLPGYRTLACLIMLGAFAWLLLTAASLEDDWRAALDLSVIAAVLMETYFGHVWCWHLLCCLGLLLSFVFNLRQFRLPLSAAVVATLAPVGHVAMFSGWEGLALTLNQAVHLLCAGAWFGGLLWLCAVLYLTSSFTWRMLQRFSYIGYGLVAGVLGTGLLNVWALTGSWPDPRTSTFGQVLTIKLALVGCMLLLAILNRSILATRSQRQLLMLRRSVVIEWCCGLAAVMAVALLGTLPPMAT
ncbi:copper homeostasis membrane protein CopD [Pseudomonas sp. PDM22]|uniref:copper homeostasis membrane protein CopD n=1 Tax=Pseudomonas sp. PDM22 TaxID=2769287 RepID=UPI0017870DF9|nr:copper homeostasis membrane protein CopD [Pseudomonas sp. PDM22]MBD9513658.1 copper homeostasis membrane protein CopD [Pseudomonas sp. PDM22]